MTARTASAKPASAVTVASNQFVAEHRAEAEALGRRLAEVVDDPELFAATLRDGLVPLGDPVYAEGSSTIAPGLGPVLGVRLPLIDAIHRTFKRGIRRTPSAYVLAACERLAREELRELRWFSMWNLEPLLRTDPERTWQLLRRFAREADEWITVDTLAHPYGAGIQLDARRWAELEQLVYSPSRWERRLVGSTLATMPFLRRFPGAREAIVAERGLELIGELIGDSEPDVQKALSWALRSLTLVDRTAVQRFLERETDTATANGDGHRAWVIRDSLTKLDPEPAARLRARLEGVRKRPGAASTSKAAETAAEFLPGLPGSPVQASGSSAL